MVHCALDDLASDVAIGTSIIRSSAVTMPSAADAEQTSWLAATLARCGQDFGTTATIENGRIVLAW